MQWCQLQEGEKLSCNPNYLVSACVLMASLVFFMLSLVVVLVLHLAGLQLLPLVAVLVLYLAGLQFCRMQQVMCPKFYLCPQVIPVAPWAPPGAPWCCACASSTHCCWSAATTGAWEVGCSRESLVWGDTCVAHACISEVWCDTMVVNICPLASTAHTHVSGAVLCSC